MDVFHGALEVEEKADCSPVTAADRASELLILEGLRARYPETPCVAEEEASAGLLPSALGEAFFLIDPLDGTREFVKRNQDFTVNIALIRHGNPVVGVVYAPARGRMFLGRPGHAEATDIDEGGVRRDARRIHVREAFAPYTIVASRSHMDEETQRYIRRLKAAELVSVGSSIKFCLIAEAGADLYPRFSRTMEWDTAAGDAILRAAGGITVTPDGSPLVYGKRDASFANPAFIAGGRFETLPL